MIQNRLPRLLGALGLAISLAGGTLFGTAVANTPNWTITAPALIGKVSNGNDAAFNVTISNAGPSNISQLYLTDDSATDTAVAAGFVAALPQPPLSANACNSSGPLYCNLGALNAGASVTVLVVYTTPAGGSSFDPIFFASSTGNTPSDGGTSHGDFAQVQGHVDLTTSGDYAGRFVFDSSQTNVSTYAALNPGNPQSTSVHSPAVLIPVSASEDATNTFCPVNKCVGQSSIVNVDFGATYTQGFTVTITFLLSSLPNWVSPNNPLSIAHQLDNGTVEYLIAKHDQDTCVFGSGPTPTNMPCLMPEVFTSTTVQVTIWGTTNGTFRGY